MWIQTDRLNIQDLKTADGIIFSGMASDDSLTEIWTDTRHPGWMEEWMEEARGLAARDAPAEEYLAYTVELKDNHEVIGSVGCTYYEDLEKIGNVRSLRAYYVYWAFEWDAFIVHIGGPYFINELIAEPNTQNIDGNLDSDAGAFFRSSDRAAPHNSYATGSGL